MKVVYNIFYLEIGVWVGCAKLLRNSVNLLLFLKYMENHVKVNLIFYLLMLLQCAIFNNNK